MIYCQENLVLGSKVEKASEYPLVFKLEADNMQNPPKQYVSR